VLLIPLSVTIGCWLAGVGLATAGRRVAWQCFAKGTVGWHEVLATQLAGTALNRAVPAGGGLVAAHLGLLRRRGRPPAAAATAVAGYAAGGVVAHLLLVVLAAAALAVGVVSRPAGTGITLPWLPVVAVAVLAAVAGALAVRHPRVRRRVGSGVRVGWAALRAQPRVVVGLAVLQAAATLLAGVGLWAAVNGAGVALPVPEVVTLYLVTTLLAGAIPVPGGAGPVDLALLTALGLTGVALGPAAAAVGTFRLITHWLPVPLGVLAAAALVPRRRWRSAVGWRRPAQEPTPRSGASQPAESTIMAGG
jgi:uncharacterized membrane protein YbhN (UPF0104 family)